MISSVSPAQPLQLELSPADLQRLISSGILKASQLRCLNEHTKQFIWQTCLQACHQCDYRDECSAACAVA